MKNSMQNKHMYLEGYLPNSLQGQKEKIIKLFSILLAATAGITTQASRFSIEKHISQKQRSQDVVFYLHL